MAVLTRLRNSAPIAAPYSDASGCMRLRLGRNTIM
ncbi:MAG: hypothetical protein J4N84_16130 [Chloroflexi bacterium]|nr:hypothetical protein [Chloroflexota bacterium]MCI0896423.1 hypothetical protein [Chloroflexota bacterium]